MRLFCFFNFYLQLELLSIFIIQLFIKIFRFLFAVVNDYNTQMYFLNIIIYSFINLLTFFKHKTDKMLRSKRASNFCIIAFTYHKRHNN